MEYTGIKLDILADIVEELSARQTSNSHVVQPYQARSWNELCEDGLRLFSELKGGGI